MRPHSIGVALGLVLFGAQGVWGQSPAETTGGVVLVPGVSSSVAHLVGVDRVPDDPYLFPLVLIRRLYDDVLDEIPRASDDLREYMSALDDLGERWDRLQPWPWSTDTALNSAEWVQHLNDSLSPSGLRVAEGAPIVLEVVERSSRRRLTSLFGNPRNSSAGSQQYGYQDRLVADLSAQRLTDLELPTFSFPLPLGVELWRDEIFRSQLDRGELFARIITERDAAMLYYGLRSLDEATLGYLADHPAVVRRIYEQHSGQFALFGRSILVSNNEIQVPGGPGSVELWERFVGEKVSEPGDFMLAILDWDRWGYGLIAPFYDVVVHLDDARRLFVLGAWLPEQRRQDHLEELFQQVSLSAPADDSRGGAFAGRFVDVSILLSQVSVDQTGSPTVVGSTDFWRDVFDVTRNSGSDSRDQSLSAPGSPIEAAGLVRTVLVDALGDRRARLQTFLFGQRILDGDDSYSLALAALRGFQHYPQLPLTLERMGATDLNAYRVSLARATQLSQLSDPNISRIALSQFQVALVLLERARLGRWISDSEASSLIQSLAAVSPANSGFYENRLALWILDTFLPSVPHLESSPEASVEEALVLAMVGISPDFAPGMQIEWEDFIYDMDPTRPRAQRLRENLARHTNSLEDIFAFVRVAERAQSEPGTLESRRLADQLEEAFGRLTPPSAGQYSRGAPVALAETVSRVANELRQDARRRDAGRIASDVGRVADVLVHASLRALLYAAYLGDADRYAAAGGEEVSARHDFALDEDDDTVTLTHGAWVMPVTRFEPGQPWSVRGSLLGLDISLADLALGRESRGLPGGVGLLPEGERQVLAATVPLMDSWGLPESGSVRIAGRLSRGRQRVRAAFERDGDIDTILRLAGIDEWRQQVMRPLVGNVGRSAQPETYFSRSELLWLGSHDETSHVEALDGWGSPAYPLGGCLCLELTSPHAFETLTGTSNLGYLAAYLPELSLRIAEVFADKELPSLLLPQVLSRALVDLFGEMQLYFSEDWFSAVRHIDLAYSAARIEDYVASLTGDGTLVPIAPVR